MSTPLTILRRVPILLIELLIRGYQVALAPLLIGSCQFVPTCSEYAIQAVREWGPIKGTWLALKRIARCNPFTKGGIDPVPSRVQRG